MYCQDTNNLLFKVIFLNRNLSQTTVLLSTPGERVKGLMAYLESQILLAIHLSSSTLGYRQSYNKWNSKTLICIFHILSNINILTPKVQIPFLDARKFSFWRNINIQNSLIFNIVIFHETRIFVRRGKAYLRRKRDVNLS